MPKVKKPRTAAALTAQSARHEPLGQTIHKDDVRNKYASGVKARRSKKNKKGRKDNDNHDDVMDRKSMERIVQMSKEQVEEIELEERQKLQQAEYNISKKKQVVLDSDDDDDEAKDDFYEDLEDLLVDTNDQGYVSMAGNTEGLSPEEEALIAQMMGNPEERQTLGDMILKKIQEKEASPSFLQEQQQQQEEGGMPQKVVEVYTDIGKILSRYTSGKLPKAFKVIPSLSNWEEVMYLTRPDLWTPQAMFAATRIFASNLNPRMAQRFYNLVLLDAVRADIQHNKRLNYHYYMALKKSVYKPAAFFRGILLPLASSNTCTLREAAIVASVLQRVSIPVMHSAVALHKLALMTEYNGAASIFIKTLLNKKYSLPAPVISSLVQHFANFVSDERTLPVLWHQALLVFVQRYKNEVQDEARNSLRVVMKKHFHYKITPEIRRELFGAQAYKDERSLATAGASVKSVGDGDSMVL